MSDTEQFVVIVGWLVLTGVGIVLTGAMMWLSSGDLRILKAEGINGAARGIAHLAFWQEFRRFIIKLALFAIGIFAFLQPEPPPICRTQNEAFGWAFVGVLYAMVIIMNYSTLEALRFRSRFIARYP